jgi:hypothetical protein
MAVSTKMAAFWVVALCSLVDFYQATWCYNPEDSHLCFSCVCRVVALIGYDV